MDNSTQKFTTKQATEYLASKGVPFSVPTLEWWRIDGRGPTYVRISSRVFYLKPDLDIFATGEIVTPEIQ